MQSSKPMSTCTEEPTSARCKLFFFLLRLLIADFLSLFFVPDGRHSRAAVLECLPWPTLMISMFPKDVEERRDLVSHILTYGLPLASSFFGLACHVCDEYLKQRLKSNVKFREPTCEMFASIAKMLKNMRL